MRWISIAVSRYTLLIVFFSAADDAICLKTTDKPAAIQRPLRQVTIVNCTLRSKAAL